MSSTVIDALIVTLGLDASGYKKGREQAEKETSETARKTKAGADEITKSLVEVGRTIAGLFLGFETATGFAKWLGGLNAGEAALGRTSKNIGMSAHELNKWGAAVTLAGGDATDAQAAFSQLTEDFQKMTTTGEQSQLLQFFRARGVNVRNENGELRDQGELYEELADKTAQYGRQYQVTMFRQAGLAQGYINYLVQSKKERQDQLRLAERDNVVTEETVKKAAELQQYWRNVGLQIEAAGQLILTAVTPVLEQVLKMFGNINAESDEFTTGLKLIGSAAVVIKNIFVGMGDAIGGAAAAIGAALHGDFKGAAAILKDQSDRSKERNAKEAADLYDLWNTPAGQAAKAAAGDTANNETYRNHNPGNLRPVVPGTRPVDSRGIRIFGSDAEGKKALEDDLRAKLHEGLTSISQIISKYAPAADHNNTAAYIADVSQKLHKGANDKTLTDADIQMLARAITIHEDAKIKTAKNGSNGPAGSQTTVQIDAMHVHSASADPRAVAEQVPAAIQRKLTVTQADTGQA